MKIPYIKLFVRDFAFDIDGLSDAQVGRMMRELISAYKTGKLPEKYKNISVFLSLFESNASYEASCERNRQNRLKSKSCKNDSSTSRQPVVNQSWDDLINHKPEPEPEPYFTPHTPRKRGGLDFSNCAYPDLLKIFADDRKSRKKPMTQKAVELADKELQKMAKNKEEAEAIVNQSILRGWQGLFAVKDTFKTQQEIDDNPF